MRNYCTPIEAECYNEVMQLIRDSGKATVNSSQLIFDSTGTLCSPTPSLRKPNHRVKKGLIATLSNDLFSVAYKVLLQKRILGKLCVTVVARWHTPP